MTSTGRLAAVPDTPACRPAADPRVRAAARVLAGDPLDAVALDAGVDTDQLLRWADALADGGAAVVGGIGLTRPDAGPAGSTVPVEDFLSVVAHELRTPLTAARTALRVLASPDVPVAVRGTVATAVLDRLADLDRLTDDLLDAVAVVTGRSRLQPERVDLSGVAADACAVAGVPHEAGPAVHVRADPARLRTVAATLLRHAARYAASSAVDVGVRELPDGALLTVRMRGVQTDATDGAAVFEPFGDAARGDGNGLAMYVVRALVVASGGAVGMAGTERPMPATVLWARLPLADPVAPDAAAHAPLALAPEAPRTPLTHMVPAARRPTAVPSSWKDTP